MKWMREVAGKGSKHKQQNEAVPRINDTDDSFIVTTEIHDIVIVWLQNVVWPRTT